MNNQIQKNVFGEPLEPCSNDPVNWMDERWLL